MPDSIAAAVALAFVAPSVDTEDACICSTGMDVCAKMSNTKYPRDDDRYIEIKARGSEF